MRHRTTGTSTDLLTLLTQRGELWDESVYVCRRACDGFDCPVFVVDIKCTRKCVLHAIGVYLEGF